MPLADLVKEQASIVSPAKAPAGIKTILFHVESDEEISSRLQLALTLARMFGAHLHLLHVTPIEAYTVTDAFGTFVSGEIVAVLEEEARKLKARLEQHLAHEDVTWDYEELTGTLMPHLIQRAALADLVVTGRQPRQVEFGGPPIAFLGDLLEEVRTPLLIAGEQQHDFDPFGSAVVAWNGSYEAANTIRQAVPLLKLSSSVKLVSVEEPDPTRFPGISVLEYLSRHGIQAELVQRRNSAADVVAELLDQVAADGAAYLVMGAYSHSRAGEFLFGGVTRTLLKACRIPLLVAG